MTRIAWEFEEISMLLNNNYMAIRMAGRKKMTMTMLTGTPDERRCWQAVVPMSTPDLAPLTFARNSV